MVAERGSAFLTFSWNTVYHLSGFIPLVSIRQIAHYLKMSEDKFNIIRFEGENFHVWKIQATAVLQAVGLWDIVSGKAKKENATDQEDWITKDGKAKARILTSLGLRQINHVASCQTSAEMWARLEATYEMKGNASKHLLMMQFFAFQWEESKPAVDNLSSLESLVTRVKAVEGLVDDETHISKILSALPRSYAHVITGWEATAKKDQTLDTLRSRILSEEIRLGRPTTSVDAFEVKGRDGGQQPSKLVNQSGASRQRQATRGGRARKGKRVNKSGCHKCGSLDHWKKDCPKNKQTGGQQSTTGFITQSTSSESVEETNAVESQFVWKADSGASHHMTPHKEWMTNYRPVSGMTVRAASGVAQVIGKGDILIQKRIKGRWMNDIIRDVLHVPELVVNLFSLIVCEDKGYSYASKECKLVILNKKNEVIAEGTRYGVGQLVNMISI